MNLKTMRENKEALSPCNFSYDKVPFDFLLVIRSIHNSLFPVNFKYFSFSIWNTMMGTSLIAMPWGIMQSGLLFGTILMLMMASIAFYTAYRFIFCWLSYITFNILRVIQIPTFLCEFD